MSTARIPDGTPLGLRAGCNVCDGPGPHPEPCDCVCHGSRSIVAWLASAEGEAWSRRTFMPAEAASHLAPFGAILPQPWGQPWRPLL